MSVREVTPTVIDAPLARARSVKLGRPADQQTPAPSGSASQDEATVSAQARRLAAAMIGQEPAPKLHLSPRELQELIMPSKRSAGAAAPGAED